ncbi:MAG: hypothetical protein LLF76_04850 [Planctomycetaceae bacterium]|nr:hypothetical protein [Planctomycetaceae bacterium]
MDMALYSNRWFLFFSTYHKAMSFFSNTPTHLPEEPIFPIISQHFEAKPPRGQSQNKKTRQNLFKSGKSRFAFYAGEPWEHIFRVTLLLDK